MPVVADIQFDYRLAIAAADAGADKIRINPGNIGEEKRVAAVVDACRRHGLPIRVGVNSGSLSRAILAKYGRPTAQALAESAMEQIACLERQNFHNYLVAIKSSDVFTTVEAYRLVAKQTDCPLHLGVTEAGTEHMGIIKSAAAFGAIAGKAPRGLARAGAFVHQQHRHPVALAQLAGKAVRAPARRLVAIVQGDRIAHDHGLRQPLAAQLIDTRPVRRSAVDFHHRQCTRALAQAAAHGHADAATANVKAQHGAVDALVHARPM